jgi:hypothetical protein
MEHFKYTKHANMLKDYPVVAPNKKLVCPILFTIFKVINYAIDLRSL